MLWSFWRDIIVILFNIIIPEFVFGASVCKIGDNGEGIGRWKREEGGAIEITEQGLSPPFVFFYYCKKQTQHSTSLLFIFFRFFLTIVFVFSFSLLFFYFLINVLDTAPLA